MIESSENPTPVEPLLQQIEEPAALRRLPREKLDQVAQELRTFLIHHASQFGGISGRA
jgi:deoxyxylulose-5-phosphate synthase